MLWSLKRGKKRLANQARFSITNPKFARFRVHSRLSRLLSALIRENQRQNLFAALRYDGNDPA
jgi:hypothetical protein